MDARGNLYRHDFRRWITQRWECLTDASLHRRREMDPVNSPELLLRKERFEPHAGLIMDSHRNLYGTTLLGASGSGGTIFS